ncbi:MAG: hypothetical protein K9L89_01385 [Kiritimatiellales bacterium]|nr:hypothetical protein [Kiritimatiellales bacterium]
MAELKREDGKRVSVKPDIFVEADQAYIKEWAAMDGFRNAASFKVVCKKELVEKWKEAEEGTVYYGDKGSAEKETVSESKFERYVYELNLENRNAFPLDGLTVEYRIFYEQGRSEKQGKVTVEEKTVPGSFDAVQLGPQEKKTLKTEPVVIHEQEFVGDYIYKHGDPEKVIGDVKGIWLRINAESPTGQTITRDVYEPASIEGKYKWPESVKPDAPKKKKGKKNV